MVVTPALERLTAGVAAALGEPPPADPHPAPSILRRLRALMSEALSDPELLPEALTGPLTLPVTGAGKYLLHRSPSFVVFCTITAPGCVLPAHDHGSWGLVGMYRGLEEEVCYVPLGAVEGVRVDGPRSSQLIPLAEARRLVHGPGSICVICPPVLDIHRLANLGDHNSVSIHLFGRDPVTSGFRTFAPLHSVTETGPLDYDTVASTGAQ